MKALIPVLTFIVTVLIASTMQRLGLQAVALTLTVLAGIFAAWCMMKLSVGSEGKKRFYFRVAAACYVLMSVLPAVLYSVQFVVH